MMDAADNLLTKQRLQKTINEQADKIEELKLAVRNLQHKLNEATDARDRERARGDIAMEFIRMATKDVEIG